MQLLRLQTYALNAANAIVRRFRNLDPSAMQAVPVAGHARFCWGKTPEDAAHSAVILEKAARMAFDTTLLRPDWTGISQALPDRHYFRKHGAEATHGQK